MAGLQTTDTKLLEGYLNAYIPDSFFLINSNITTVDHNPKFNSSNLYKYKAQYMDETVANGVSAGTAQYHKLNTYANTSVITRLFTGRYVSDAEALAGDMTQGEKIQKIGTQLAYTFGKSVDSTLFTNTLSAMFSVAGVGGCLTANHLYQEAGRADKKFSVSGMLKSASLVNGIRYAYIHKDLWTANALWAELEPLNVVNSETPNDTAFNTELYKGKIDGVHVFVTDKLPVSGSGANAVYDVYLFGDNALHLEFQRDYQPNVFFKPDLDGGSTVGQVMFAYDVGVQGVNWAGGSPSDALAGATLAERGTASNWSVPTGVNANEIKVTCYKCK